MGLFNRLFNKEKKPPWEVLKVYTSISVDQPSSFVRQHFVNALLGIFERHYDQAPVSFDICGPYGIPKGKRVGIKRFNNLLQTKGYEKFYGFSMENRNHEICFEFLDTSKDLKLNGWSHGYQELIIAHNNPPYSINLLQIAGEIFEVFKCDYGYITQLPNNYDLASESKITNMLGMISTVHSTIDWSWRANTNRILTGNIKDVYPINLLNDQQTNKINKMNFEVRKFNDTISIWSIKEDERKTIREKLKQELIINTPTKKN
jgi:hypothetical protein